MKFRKTMQECNCCSWRFPIVYFEDGGYEYLERDEAPCDCEGGFSPTEGEPSICEWLIMLRGKK